jgi:carboxyl-terminal processing protease
MSATLILKDFTATASREVRNAFQELKGKGMKYVVLDLRDNPGGLLNMAIEISNIFYSKRPRNRFYQRESE